MKKIILSIVTLTLLYSCKKEQVQKQSEVATTNTNLEQKQVMNRILNFKKLMEDKTLSSEEMTVDDAVWDLEALVNYTYDKPQGKFDDFILDTLIFNIPVNSKLATNDIKGVYKTLNTHLANITNKTKFLRVLDVAVKEQTPTTLTLMAISWIGNEKSVFNPDDYWYSNLGAGKCGGYAGSVGLDATDIIPRQLTPIGWPLGSHFINVTSTAWISPYDTWIVDNPITNPFGYDNVLLFSRSGSGTAINTCMGPTELDFYRTNLVTIANLLNPTPSAPKTVIVYDLQSDFVVPNYGWNYTHDAQITYGDLRYHFGF